LIVFRERIGFIYVRISKDGGRAAAKLERYGRSFPLTRARVSLPA
jgi:hypothetical protein